MNAVNKLFQYSLLPLLTLTSCQKAQEQKSDTTTVTVDVPHRYKGTFDTMLLRYKSAAESEASFNVVEVNSGIASNIFRPDMPYYIGVTLKKGEKVVANSELTEECPLAKETFKAGNNSLVLNLCNPVADTTAEAEGRLGLQLQKILGAHNLSEYDSVYLLYKEVGKSSFEETYVPLHDRNMTIPNVFKVGNTYEIGLRLEKKGEVVAQSGLEGYCAYDTWTPTADEMNLPNLKLCSVGTTDVMVKLMLNETAKVSFSDLPLEYRDRYDSVKIKYRKMGSDSGERTVLDFKSEDENKSFFLAAGPEHEVGVEFIREGTVVAKTGEEGCPHIVSSFDKNASETFTYTVCDVDGHSQFWKNITGINAEVKRMSPTLCAERGAKWYWKEDENHCYGKVAMIADPEYIDMSGSPYAEGTNIIKMLESQGLQHTIIPELTVDNLETATKDAKFLIVPEQERANIIKPNLVEGIRKFAKNGGIVIYHPTYITSEASPLFRSLTGTTKLDRVASGSMNPVKKILDPRRLTTSYYQMPVELNLLSGTVAYKVSNFPYGTFSFYDMYQTEGEKDEAYMVAGYIPVDKTDFGYMLFMGWDWFNYEGNEDAAKWKDFYSLSLRSDF